MASKRMFAIVAVVLMLFSGGCAGRLVSTAIGVPFEAARLGQKLTFAQIETSVKVAKGGIELAGGTVDLVDRTGRAIHSHKMRGLEYDRVASAR